MIFHQTVSRFFSYHIYIIYGDNALDFIVTTC